MPERLIIRRWKTGAKTPVALFPDWCVEHHPPHEPAQYTCLINSYMHVGQHGAADYHTVMSQTRPIKSDEPDAIEFLAEVRRTHDELDLKLTQRRGRKCVRNCGIAPTATL